MPEILEAPVQERELEQALGVAGPAEKRAIERGGAVLVSSLITADARVLGSHQRSMKGAYRRASTGATALLTGRVVHHVLALPSVEALVPDATLSNLLNRNLRGFLKAYTRAGVLAHYFGRDHLTFVRRPGALVGYDVGRKGSVVIEVFVGLDAATVESEEAAPGVLTLCKRSPEELVDVVHRTLADHWGARRTRDDVGAVSGPREQMDEPPAGAKVGTVTVPIGTVEVHVAGDDVFIRTDALGATYAFDDLAQSFSAAVALGSAIDDDLLAPLAGAPLEGARPSDFLDALRAALDA